MQEKEVFFKSLPVDMLPHTKEDMAKDALLYGTAYAAKLSGVWVRIPSPRVQEFRNAGGEITLEVRL